MQLNRETLRKLYVDRCLFGWPRLVGGFYLRFYRLIYPGFRVGKNPAVWGRFNVMMFAGGTITIGDNLHMVSQPARCTSALFARARFTTFSRGCIRLGNRVGLNGTTITSKKGITIEDGTMIAQNVIIVDSDFHAQWPPEARLHSDTSDYDKEVVIGKNVWIGMNCLVLKGVQIGDNSIIGAGSVVVKSIPSGVMAAGNPARVIRELR
jgi:acetyltransferase-like isoleucine patch superfamily enzyme